MSSPTYDCDVCLILEGAYPYVPGGVSSWAHDLIKAHADLRFHLVVLCADSAPRKRCFELPENVVGMSTIPLQQEERSVRNAASTRALMASLEEPLQRLLCAGSLADLDELLRLLRAHPATCRADLLNSQASFDLVQRMYLRTVPGSSFLRYFWSWRSLLGGLFSLLFAPLPQARVYHAISTGYAGLVLARATLETGRPGLLTEHGIYTNERRVEIMMANWLADDLPPSLGVDHARRDLRNVWNDAFSSYSRICYQAASRIITLYKGNQLLQMRDGAPPERLMIIANGVDADGLSRISVDPAPRPPTVALIGRVVPIKDVKTFIRAIALLRVTVPDVQALVLGPADEDPGYMAECQSMVAHLGLQEAFHFLGKVRLADHLGRIDVIALTSISEAQPLVLLEAGAARVPSVATDVGSCREIIDGRADEQPSLGPGGRVVPPGNPAETARALAQILKDPALRLRYGESIQRRVTLHYNKNVIDRIYGDLYREYIEMPDSSQRRAA
jgi:glycosyltransferase involved in cell wall biosynthesis